MYSWVVKLGSISRQHTNGHVLNLNMHTWLRNLDVCLDVLNDKHFAAFGIVALACCIWNCCSCFIILHFGLLFW